MFELNDIANSRSVINISGISKNIKKECNTNKLPDKAPKLHILPAISRLTKKEKNKSSKNRAEVKHQLLENIQTGNPNFNIKKMEIRQNQIKTVKLLSNVKKRGTLQEDEEQDFDSEIQEIIEILRNALMNINSDGETRELHSAVNVFVKSGFQTFKEHRKHIEKAILHIDSHKLLNNEAKIVSIIRSKINKLNEINSIKSLGTKEVNTVKTKNVTLSR